MSLENIAIVGASGNLGALVLPVLLKSKLSLTAVIRETSSAKFPGSVKIVKSDFKLGSLTEAFKGQDAVISMLPITALGDQGVVIEAAIAAGVKRFIPSEYGSDSTTFFQGLTGFDLTTKTVTLVDGGKTRFTASTVAQIGRALIAVLSHATETANRVVFVESFTTTQLEVLTAVEEATGEKWKVVDANSKDIRAEGFKKMEEGNILEGGAALIQAAVLGKEALEDHTHVKGGIWNDRLGLKQESVEEEVKRILQTATAKQ
ncbi:hypothetical protein Asppvi_001936 [Aspergillus pseudoviridinutans]|uniref:NmrA-like domain-containing protein n=1 Tax=Aspergillus pseudoviridinutans TaxID=1517512 RepID=A0A9P3BQI0_9EURO|nr:uncharacterized protein Asppvi_001936 [Aspergillus pseudoviridinutans]GIJ92658.1 hypothetical protein Asppvi_001936 [Aspergillus pseudoviridinutans]